MKASRCYWVIISCVLKMVLYTILLVHCKAKYKCLIILLEVVWCFEPPSHEMSRYQLAESDRISYPCLTLLSCILWHKRSSFPELPYSLQVSVVIQVVFWRQWILISNSLLDLENVFLGICFLEELNRNNLSLHSVILYTEQSFTSFCNPLPPSPGIVGPRRTYFVVLFIIQRVIKFESWFSLLAVTK